MYFSTKQMKRYSDIRNDIEAYVFDVIVPLYKGFDSAHREDHALTVISQAMELLDDLLCNIPAYRLTCRPDAEAVEVLYRAIYGESHGN